MPVITVLGEINCEDLGIVATHEHILIDLSNSCYQPEFTEITRKTLYKQKVELKNLGFLTRHPDSIRDNLILDDLETAEKELMEFKKAGGDTIIDVTSIGLGRDPVALRNISRVLGLNIIAGCGYYTHDFHPEEIKNKSIEDIESEMLKDINTGISDTDIRAGIIGEIGTSEKIYPNEKKILIAAAKANAKTRTPISVHPEPCAKNGLEILDILSKNGADLKKVIICHLDINIDIDYCKEIIKSGAFIEFDTFGKEYYLDKRFIDKRFRGNYSGIWSRDFERVDAIKDLINAGLISSILISCDICYKTQLHRYGGWGYDHILTNILPMMSERGINKEQTNILLQENPKRIFQ